MHSEGRIVFDWGYLLSIFPNTEPRRIEIMLKCAPILKQETGNYSYMHKSFFEFYLTLGVVNDFEITFKER